MILVPAPALAESETQDRVRHAIKHKRPTLVYFMDKLGGEIDLPGSRKSPKFKLDTTLVEMLPSEDGVGIGKHGILEVQTMDYHDWTHLTGTFTFGSDATKEELDEIIRQSLTLWAKAG